MHSPLQQISQDCAALIQQELLQHLAPLYCLTICRLLEVADTPVSPVTRYRAARLAWQLRGIVGFRSQGACWSDHRVPPFTTPHPPHTQQSHVDHSRLQGAPSDALLGVTRAPVMARALARAACFMQLMLTDEYKADG